MSKVLHSILATHPRRLAAVYITISLLLVYACFVWIFAESVQVPSDNSDPLFKKNDVFEKQKKAVGAAQIGGVFRRAPPSSPVPNHNSVELAADLAAFIIADPEHLSFVSAMSLQDVTVTTLESTERSGILLYSLYV